MRETVFIFILAAIIGTIAGIVLATAALGADWDTTGTDCGDGGTLWINLDDMTEQDCREPQITQTGFCDGGLQAEDTCWTPEMYDQAYPEAGLENPRNTNGTRPSERLLGADMGDPLRFVDAIRVGRNAID